MKILIDMNFSPQWCKVIEKYGWEALHWSEVGAPKAKHRTIIRTYAKTPYIAHDNFDELHYSHVR